MIKGIKLNLDSGESLGSQVDDIVDAFEACGVEVREDPETAETDHSGYILSVPTPEAEEPTTAEEMQAPATEEEIMAPVTFKDACFGIRSDIELIKKKCANTMEHPEFDFVLSEHTPPTTRPKSVFSNHSEMRANLMLAYRHLEDARMRIGKVLQAYDGGQSVYPK